MVAYLNSLCSTSSIYFDYPIGGGIVQDVIEREIIINASKESIYDAITNPQEVIKWFPETIEGRYEVGEQPIFGFGSKGRSQIYIVAAQPYEYFAYRWVPGSSHYLGDVLAVPNTLVEFRIMEYNQESCKVILKESGFSKLPGEYMDAALEQNSTGWDFMLGRLEKLFGNA